MKVTEIRYERKLSDGNYGSEGISITGSIGDGLDPLAEIDKLKLLVEAKLFGDLWTRNYEQAVLVVNDAVMHDQTPETYEAARQTITNYETWHARVLAAKQPS